MYKFAVIGHPLSQSLSGVMHNAMLKDLNLDGQYETLDTESEDLVEMDRFINAMISIRKEIADIESGKISIEDSVLRNAPHTAEDLAGDWNRKYSREEAVFPVPSVRSNKYWPPVNRIDGAYGDRNLICSCPSPRELANS